MVVVVDKLLLEIEAKFKHLDKVDKFNKNLDQMNLRVTKNGKLIDKTTNKFVSNTEALKRHQKVQEQAKKSMQGMDQAMLSFGFGLLFTGMALKAFSQNVIKGLTNAFTVLADETNEGLKRVLELQAGLQFLKFVLFDTFANTDLFASFVENLVLAGRWLSELVQKNPDLAALTGLFLILSVVLGTVAMGLGQLALLAFALGIGFLPLLGIIFLITAAITLLFVLWIKKGDDVIKVLGTLAIVLGTILLIMALLGIAITLPFVIGILAIGILVGALFLLAKKTGGVKNAFKAMGVFILAIFAFIGDAIFNAIITPVRLAITLINALIRGNNALAGTKLGRKAGLSQMDLIDQPAAMPLSSKVWEMRNNLIEQGNQSKEEGKNVMEIGEDSLDKLSTKLEDKIFSKFDIAPTTDL